MEGSLADWVAVDWGTTHLRAWIIGADGTPLARLASDRGMGRLTADEFEPALLALISPYLPETTTTSVLCCGMAGARQGWQEAPYVPVPCGPPGAGLAVSVATRDKRIGVGILPGVRQMSPADVMRGEETQVAGFMAEYPGFDGVVCLPGTHTKWVQVSAGEIVSFRTFMTGELFSLIATQSVLRHTLDENGWDDDAFSAAVEEGLAHPQRLASALFTLRAESLLNGLSGVAARSRLSGLLIGVELTGARPYWLGQKIALVGAEALARIYADALGGLGSDVTICDGEKMTLAGLSAAHADIAEVER